MASITNAHMCRLALLYWQMHEHARAHTHINTHTHTHIQDHDAASRLSDGQAISGGHRQLALRQHPPLRALRAHAGSHW